MELPLKEGRTPPPGREAQAGVQPWTSRAGMVGAKLETRWARVMIAASPGLSPHLPVALGTHHRDLLSRSFRFLP